MSVCRGQYVRKLSRNQHSSLVASEGTRRAEGVARRRCFGIGQSTLGPGLKLRSVQIGS